MVYGWHNRRYRMVLIAFLARRQPYTTTSIAMQNLILLFNLLNNIFQISQFFISIMDHYFFDNHEPFNKKPA